MQERERERGKRKGERKDKKFEKGNKKSKQTNQASREALLLSSEQIFAQKKTESSPTLKKRMRHETCHNMLLCESNFQGKNCSVHEKRGKDRDKIQDCQLTVASSDHEKHRKKRKERFKNRKKE